ncbi:LytTR family DNA-binding domain-containing protein [uncultured Sunxiuqinia sp.]|uniref:LytR/AlgR family response regulator transcription factor n=1 Tax=uncultured Sunxiuqinia sp. TaxID=1573825 RepID=UPI002AA9117B|nr:LytTR family DNA-binding domain-containing protein [uncultured Sunxiuqinia sp.]
MIRAIVVDDEPLAQNVIKQFAKDIPELEIVCCCNNALEASSLLKDEHADLMFLDVNMPRLSGLDFLKNLTNPPLVILTTAYADYAMEGYELNILDYLKKPFSFERFYKAVQKADEQLKLMTALHHEEHNEDYIYIKANKKAIRVEFKSIIYIEGLGDYIKVHLKDKHLVTNLSMKKMEELLPAAEFFRIHKSYIIRLDQIQSIEGNQLEINGQKLPIGNNFRHDFQELINKHIIK